MSARIVCSYEDKSISEAVASSIKPDNIDSPENVEVETRRSDGNVKSRIKVDGEIETLLATMDDLLSCTSTAEKMI